MKTLSAEQIAEKLIYDCCIHEIIDAAKKHALIDKKFEDIVQAIDELDEFIKLIVAKAFLDARTNVRNGGKDFRMAAIGKEVTFCFAFSDDRDFRPKQLMYMCKLISTEYNIRSRIVGITTEKTDAEHPTYDFCLIEFDEEKVLEERKKLH